MGMTTKEMTKVEGLYVVPVNCKTVGKMIEVTASGFELRDYRQNELKQFCYVLVDACRAGDISFLSAHNERERIRNLKKRFPSAEFLSAECCGIRTA